MISPYQESSSRKDQTVLYNRGAGASTYSPSKLETLLYNVAEMSDSAFQSADRTLGNGFRTVLGGYQRVVQSIENFWYRFPVGDYLQNGKDYLLFSKRSREKKKAKSPWLK